MFSAERPNSLRSAAAGPLWPKQSFTPILITGTGHSSVTTFATADGIIYSLPDSNGANCSGEPTVNADGTVEENFDIYSATNCGTGVVDVNGAKGPNQHVSDSSKPQDQFEFLIFETKVIPGTSAGSVEAAVMYDKKGVTAGS